jgi:hypothetical protein
MTTGKTNTIKTKEMIMSEDCHNSDSDPLDRILEGLLREMDDVDEMEWILSQTYQEAGINPARILNSQKGTWK